MIFFLSKRNISIRFSKYSFKISCSFFSPENILYTINPYIYDQKQITVGKSNETLPRKVYLETHWNNVLTVFAKPSKFKKGDFYVKYCKYVKNIKSRMELNSSTPL